MKVEVDLSLRVLRVSDFVYSLDVLAHGMETPNGHVCTIAASAPAADGTRRVLVNLLAGGATA